MAKPKHETMVKVVWYLPLWLKEELDAIKTRDGVTLSQQARMSLTMWAARCKRDPHGALGALNPRGFGSVPTEPEAEYTPAPPLGPEPDPATHPAEWASWSARAGAAAIAKLAKGDWTP